MILAIAALAPPIYLMVYIYKKDKVDKEPPDLVVKTFIYGMISTFPAIILELFLGGVILALFPEGSMNYYVVDSFIGVAIVEEIVKMAAVRLSVWNCRDFNYTFDGVVYAAAAALGFAALENVSYVFMSGLGTALVRAVTSIPGHFTFGVFMGMYLGLAKLAESRGDVEGRRTNMAKALLIPTLLHGFYDCMLFISTGWSMLLFLAFLIILDSFAVRMIRRLEENDEFIPGPGIY